MDTLFLVCALVGGTVMVLQFLMTLLGLGDTGSEMGDFGGVGDADFSGDIADLEDGGVKFSEAADADFDKPTSSWLFGVLSFRTVVAAIAFFGLAGKAALAAEYGAAQSLGVAVGAGAAAMYGVYALMRGIYKLRSEGTVRISGAVGLRGTVYVPIPAGGTGAGKIQLNLQNRTVEYAAMTEEEDKLPTGARIVVTRVLGPETLGVERIPEVADVSEE